MMDNNNTLAHFSINADNVDRARAFYEKVFGWKFSAWGPPNFYQIEAKGSPAGHQTPGNKPGRREQYL